MTLNGGSIRGNRARLDGGGIYNTGTDAEVTLDGGTITGNTAERFGGGIYNVSGTVDGDTSSLVTGNNPDDIFQL